MWNRVKYDYQIDPVLGAALVYWKGKGGRSMPARRDIDPTEMRRLLPHVQLIEPVADRFRFRLVGTALAEAFGRDYTGRFVDELFDRARAGLICEVYRAVLERRQPMFLRNRYFTAKDTDLIANRVYLPLSEDDSAVNMIFGAVTFEFGALPVAGAWGSATLVPADQVVETVDVV
jgi:hypothetical protein